MKSQQQLLREASVVGGCTVIWTALAVFTFDRIPEAWFQSAAASFAPATGKVIAAWFLPTALLILFVAGWIATLSLVFRMFGWRVRDVEPSTAQAVPAEIADGGDDEHAAPVQESADPLG